MLPTAAMNSPGIEADAEFTLVGKARATREVRRKISARSFNSALKLTQRFAHPSRAARTEWTKVRRVVERAGGVPKGMIALLAHAYLVDVTNSFEDDVCRR